MHYLVSKMEKFRDKINVFVKRSTFLSFIKFIWFKRKWRNRNQHNFTQAGNCFNSKRVSVGIGSYGKLSVFHFISP